MGFNQSINSNEILAAPCTNGRVFNSSIYAFAPDLHQIPNVVKSLLESGNKKNIIVWIFFRFKNVVINFIGASNATECELDMNEIVRSASCPYKTCATDSVYQPSVQNRSFEV
jgi:hypothetical protein